MIISTSPYLFHSMIFPFFKVNLFGIFSALSILTVTILLVMDKRSKKLLPLDLLLQLVSELVIVGVISAKLLYGIEHWKELSAAGVSYLLDTKGYSLLGAFIGLPAYIFYRLKTLKIDFWKFSDLIASKIPALQAVARLGCHFAGCCAGIAVDAAVACCSITYTNPDSIAPLNVTLMPIQLYTSMASVAIFFILMRLQTKFKKDGQILGAFLILEGLARFTTDFYRLNRQMISVKYTGLALSVSQILSMGVIIAGALIWIQVTKRKKS